MKKNKKANDKNKKEDKTNTQIEEEIKE